MSTHVAALARDGGLLRRVELRSPPPQASLRFWAAPASLTARPLSSGGRAARTRCRRPAGWVLA
eukprot:4920181-Alexandrium_andersonii.AAC.1